MFGVKNAASASQSMRSFNTAWSGGAHCRRCRLRVLPRDGRSVDSMDEEPLYTTVDGKQVTLYQMVLQEPGWAVARIRLCEQQARQMVELARENAELKRRLALACSRDQSRE